MEELNIVSTDREEAIVPEGLDGVAVYIKAHHKR